MKKILLTYIGKRIVGNKILPTFLDPNGEEAHFQRVRYAGIGYQYKAYETKDSIKIRLPLQEVPGERHEKADEWTAQSWAADSEHKKKRLRMRADKCKNLIRDIDHIKQFTKNLNVSEIHEFVCWLVDELYKERRAKMLEEARDSIRKSFKRRARA